jgi:hypothetical protein
MSRSSLTFIILVCIIILIGGLLLSSGHVVEGARGRARPGKSSGNKGPSVKSGYKPKNWYELLLGI